MRMEVFLRFPGPLVRTKMSPVDNLSLDLLTSKISLPSHFALEPEGAADRAARHL